MPHVLALEWDDAEARLAIADVRRGSIVLEQAFAVSLANTAPGSGADTAAGKLSLSGAHDLNAIGRRISEALAVRGIRRGKTLVGVGRANIELKNLSVPQSPPEDLPDMVRFQAERDFNTLGEDWPLDFVQLPSEEGEALNVLAAAISPELVAEIEVTRQAANLTPSRLMLRPCAAAALLSRVKPGKENKLRLLVDLLAEEADLTVLSGDVVVFMRTARLPQGADPLRALVPEIRRTIAAVHNRSQGQRIEEMFVCGDTDAQSAVVRDIGRDLELHAEVFNPLKSVTLGGDLRRELPNQPSRFAPLIGMLLDESAPGEGIIDFLNPRKRPEAKSRKREYTMIGAAVVLFLASIAGWIFYSLQSLDTQIADLSKKSNQLGENAKDTTDTPVKKALQKTAKANEIQKFQDSKVPWLDELAALSLKAPPAKEIMITHLTTPPEPLKRTSKLFLDVAAASSETQEKVSTLLRDPGHQVSLGTAEQHDDSKYPWKFKVNLVVDPTKNDLAAVLKEKATALQNNTGETEMQNAPGGRGIGNANGKGRSDRSKGGMPAGPGRTRGNEKRSEKAPTNEADAASAPAKEAAAP